MPAGRPARRDIAAVLRDGHRLSVRTIALGVVPLAATAVAARLGAVPLAGQQVAYRLWGLLSLSTDALAVPAQVYVSAALGRGDRAAAEVAARRTLVLGLAAGCGLAVVTAALALGAPQAFTADPAVRAAAVTALLCSALTQPLAALAFVYDGVILGLGDYRAMRRAMILAIVAFVPLAALVAAVPLARACPACGPRSAAGWRPGRCCSGGAGRGPPVRATARTPGRPRRAAREPPAQLIQPS